MASDDDHIKQLDLLKSQLVSRDCRILEMQALLHSARSLSAILDLPRLLDTFMSIVRERYDVTSSAVLLRQESEAGERAFYQVSRFYGLKDHYLNSRGGSEPLQLFRIEKDDGLLWQMISQGGVVTMWDPHQEPRFKSSWDRNRLEVLGSDLWCPLMRSGEVLGILSLGQKRDGTKIDESEYPFLVELSAMASVIIDSAIHLERNKRALENTRTLYQFNQTLSEIHDFDSFCRKMLENAVRAVNAQKGNLMMLNRASGRLEVVMSWGHVFEDPAKVKPFEIGEGAAGKAALDRKPVVQNNRDEILQVEGDDIHCICSVPVLNGGVLEGVMNFSNKVHVNQDGTAVQDWFGRFSKDDVQLLQGMADQSAVSLHKSRLYSASITDRLTGLHNARFFEDTYQELVAAAVVESKPLTLALLDIDHFKLFNDQFGHRAGDFILKSVADLFQSIRQGDQDHVYRYGGEEFCMVFSGVAAEDALLRLEEFRQKIEKHEFHYEGKSLKVTVSMGLAECGLHSKDARVLFNLADEALYESKRQGRNQIRMAKFETIGSKTA
jgi:diguanylate cyclase (GGDEF)-like protein